MKKILPAILLLIAVMLTFSGCKTKSSQPECQPYTAYVDVGLADGDAGARVKAENRYTPIADDAIPEPAKSTISVTMLDAQYSAEYVKKGARTFGRPQYTYRTEAGDEISTDASGKVLSLLTARSFDYYSRDPESPDVKATIKSPEEYLDIATQYARRIFGDDITARYAGKVPKISSTKIWVDFLPESSENGLTRTDFFTIVVSAEGELLAYYDFGVDDFKDKTAPADLTDERISRIILDSLTDKKAEIEISGTKNWVILNGGKSACYTSFKTVGDGYQTDWADVIIPLE